MAFRDQRPFTTTSVPVSVNRRRPGAFANVFLASDAVRRRLMCHGSWELSKAALENFIPFEKFKRLNKRKYFVIPTASHKLHIFVTYKRLIWIQFDPFAHSNIINEVAHNSYNKIFPFGTPFAFLKRNKIFQWRDQITKCHPYTSRFTNYNPTKLLTAVMLCSSGP